MGESRKEDPLFKRVYSEVFKRGVVKDIEAGFLNKDEARGKYKISGKTTVLGWCRKYGKLTSLGVNIGTVNNKKGKELDVLKARIRELEKGLSNSNLKVELLEKIIDLAEREYKIPIRKKSGAKQY